MLPGVEGVFEGRYSDVCGMFVGRGWIVPSYLFIWSSGTTRQARSRHHARQSQGH